jgi:hypothetical protein
MQITYFEKLVNKASFRVKQQKRCCTFFFLILNLCLLKVRASLWQYIDHVCNMAQVYSDLTVDYLKMFLLNAPATVVALGL